MDFHQTPKAFPNGLYFIPRPKVLEVRTFEEIIFSSQELIMGEKSSRGEDICMLL
jgi:hypothetical protein